jgi:hypothetical protein
VTPLAEYRVLSGRRPFSPAFATLAKAIDGIPLDLAEQELFRQMSGGRSERPGVGFWEVFVNAGRGSGKDDFVSSLTVRECRFVGHEIAGAPGQRLPFQVVCPLRNQAQGTIKMTQGEASLPFNRRYVARQTADSVEFVNGTVAQVQTCDDVAVVGDTLIGLVFNEWSLFSPDGSASSARNVENNARPALRRMRGTPRKLFIKLGSSYIKDGSAWECYRDCYGRDDAPVLVVAGPTEFWNPNVDPAFLESERRALGELLFSMHYGGVWPDAVVEAWFGSESIIRARQEGLHELPRKAEVPVHIALDLSTSTTSRDKVGWAVASSTVGDFDHELGARRSRRTVLHTCGAWDVDRSPREIARRLRDEVCDRFGTRRIIIDQYSDQAFAQLCRDVGLTPKIIPWRGGEAPRDVMRETEAERLPTKSDRYRSVRTAMASGDLLIPDNAELLADLRACRGTLLPGGGERIEVPRSTRGHGDVLSASVMALSQAMIGNARIPESELTDAERRERARKQHATRQAMIAFACGGGSFPFFPESTQESALGVGIHCGSSVKTTKG